MVRLQMVGALAHLLADLVADADDFGAAQAGRHFGNVHGKKRELNGRYGPRR